MTAVNIITVMAIALLAYWLVGLIAYIVVIEFFGGSEDDFMCLWAFGLVGILFALVTLGINRFRSYRRRKYAEKNKRVIICERATGKEYYCTIDEYQDFYWYTPQSCSPVRNKYAVINSKADLSEIEGIPHVTDEMIARARVNCDNCEYRKSCDKTEQNGGEPFCTVDPKSDMVETFDRFRLKERK